MAEHTAAREFFDTYARALLDRNAKAIAEHYAVPALIVAPGQMLPVTAAAQTEEFFASAIGQYDGVTQASPDVTVIAETGHSLWADVTWFYDAAAAERNMYQLVPADQTWQIAVLTPLGA